MVAVSNSIDRFNGLVAQLAIKAPCVAVAIANITLSGEQTVNGVAVVSGDRVLVTAQTSSVDNGIYDASDSAWSRSADFDGNRDVTSGTFVTVATATVGRNPYYQVTTANPITIGTTAIDFTLADGANVSYDLTAREIAVGLTADDISDSFDQGHLYRYGTNTTPGTTLMTTGMANMALVGGECFIPGDTVMTGNVALATSININMAAAAIVKQADNNNTDLFAVSTDNFNLTGGTIDMNVANNATTDKFAVSVKQNGSTGYDDIKIEDVFFTSGNSTAVDYRGGSNFQVRHCRFLAFPRGAISLICQDGGADIVDPKIIGNTVDCTNSQLNDAAFKFRGSADGNSTLKHLRCSFNKIKCDSGSTSNPLVGIGMPRPIERSFITNNIIEGGLIGVSCGSFVGIDTASTGGPLGTVIANNTFFDQQLEAVELAMNARDTVVANNTIDGNANCLRGILASGQGANSIIRALITGNTIRNLDTTVGIGVNVASGANEVSVIGNYINVSNAINAIRYTNVSANNAIKSNTIDCEGTGNNAIILDNSAGVDISGNTINDAEVYCVALIDDSADTFVDGDVATGTDRITLTAHFHANADEVTLTSSGTLPAGLALATTYYTKSIDVDTIELYSDVGLSSIVDITAAAGGGTHKILRTAKNLRITGNDAFNFGTAFFINTDTQPYGTGNKIQNNFDIGAQTFTSADATPSVLIGSQFLSNATGVTITRFDDGYIGQEITIISKGATVYDTSTATRLIGSSVDITTASGDVTTWICETGGTSSSVWRLKGFVDVSVNNSAGA